MKAIFTTSANPFHYGHLYLYREASKIFGNKNVKVVIGKNSSKNLDLDLIKYHIIPYNIDFDIADNISLFDYCKDNKVDYIVRGLRNDIDLNYELKLNYKYNNIKTLYISTNKKLSNISSFNILELIKNKNYDEAIKYMNPISMYRYINKKSKYNLYNFKSSNSFSIDQFFIEYFYNYYKVNFSFEKISILENNFWFIFFDYIENTLNITDIYFSYIDILWNTIPNSIKGKMYFIFLNSCNYKNFKYFDKIIYE